jgi:hypothetical protein
VTSEPAFDRDEEVAGLVEGATRGTPDDGSVPTVEKSVISARS